jgi:hypothetical protein
LAYATLSADVVTLGEVALLQQLEIATGALDCPNPRPFGIAMHGFYVGEADMDKGTPGHIRYAEGEVDLVYTQKLTHCEGISYILGVDKVLMNWNDNPYFNATTFRGLDFGVLAYTTRVKDWLWQVGMAAQYSLDYGGLGRYTRYTAMAWGRYEYSDTLGVHAGFYAFYNLRRNKVFPIIGVDWSPWKKWQFNLIFPMSIAVNYSITPCWTVDLAWRPIWSRHRVGSNEPVPRAIWENRDNGAELGINFTSPILQGGLFLGYSFGGTLKIMDYLGNNPVYYKYNGSPYVGLRVMAPF